MTDQHEHMGTVGAALSIALASALIFGAVVLASGDWLPGTIIVVAAAAGLVRLVPVLRRLRGAPTVAHERTGSGASNRDGP